MLCQFSDGSTPPSDGSPRLTLADYVPVPGVYPAGRLDFDSEGLLLLTDDGALQHRLTDPKYGHQRAYWVQLEGDVSDQALARLAAGLLIQGQRTLPCRAERITEPRVPARVPAIRARRNIPTSWIRMVLTEGRNRQIRRMTAAVGFPTLRLIRAEIGPITIGTLQPGQWRHLSDWEIRWLKKGVG